MAFITKVAPAISVAALAISSAAFAQDSEPYFDGPYISGTIGLDAAKDSGGDRIVFDTDQDGTFNDDVLTVTDADAFSPGFCAGRPIAATPGCRGNTDDEGYSVRVGYDQQMGDGPFVAGVLIEGAKPGVKESTAGFSTTPASYTFQREIDWAINARARLGVAPGAGRVLFYGTGGVGYARIERDFTTSNGANSFTPSDNNDWQFGWQAGGGAEIMLTRNLGIGLEYLFSSYNDDEYTVAVGPGTAPATNPFLLESGGTDMRLSNDRFDYHSLRATVNVRF